MDLSKTYRNIVRRHFPDAMIVSDRFHVIRLINHHYLKIWARLIQKVERIEGYFPL